MPRKKKFEGISPSQLTRRVIDRYQKFQNRILQFTNCPSLPPRHPPTPKPDGVLILRFFKATAKPPVNSCLVKLNLSANNSAIHRIAAFKGPSKRSHIFIVNSLYVDIINRK